MYRVVEGFTPDLEWPEEVGVEEGCEYYNAARPFPAHLTWQGRFLHGVFYGMIDPAMEFADEYRERAEALDAHRLRWVSRAEVEEWALEYCQKYDVTYEAYGYEEFVRAYLRHAEGDDDEGGD